MSSVPPDWNPPPPPPPLPPMPPGGGPEPTGLPWERRSQYGFVPALVETVKLFVTAPQEAWARTPQRGGLVDPLLFSILLTWAGFVASSVYSMFFTAPWLQFLPEEARDRLGMGLAGHAGWTFVQVIFAPIGIVIGLFIGCAILHVCVMVVGGLSQSSSGFEGTFRAMAYSSVADLANFVPLMGGLIAVVWKLVLVVLGIVALHRTTPGKAIAAVLIPVVICCVCVSLGVMMLVGVIAGFMGR